MERAPVDANLAVAEQRVVGRDHLHGRDNRLAIVGVAHLVDGISPAATALSLEPASDRYVFIAAFCRLALDSSPTWTADS